MGKLIYVADDELNIRTMIKAFLENEGFEVEIFENGSEIRKAFARREPDMIILDVMMPGEDGYSLCSYFRKNSRVPILIVSAKGEPLDRVTGIMLGSDDYIVKPFLPLEFIARVKALFRRAELDLGAADAKGSEANIFTCGNLEIHKKERKVYVGSDPVPATPMEFDFLLCLIMKKEAAVSKQELLEEVWEVNGCGFDQRMPDDLVKRLRKKLREYKSDAMIETVWGYGFRRTEKIDI